MARITVPEAQAWLEGTKLTITALDTELEASVSAEVIGRVSSQYDTTTWSAPSTTPALIRKVIAMLYVSWFYNRQYSEESELESWYAERLRQNAYMLLEGIAAGTALLVEIEGNPAGYGDPLFYPTDDQEADGSGEETKFRIGSVF